MPSISSADHVLWERYGSSAREEAFFVVGGGITEYRYSGRTVRAHNIGGGVGLEDGIHNIGGGMGLEDVMGSRVAGPEAAVGMGDVGSMGVAGALRGLLRLMNDRFDCNCNVLHCNRYASGTDYVPAHTTPCTMHSYTVHYAGTDYIPAHADDEEQLAEGR
jgi:hypothetical protein